jgi:hypothetical protein
MVDKKLITLMSYQCQMASKSKQRHVSCTRISITMSKPGPQSEYARSTRVSETMSVIILTAHGGLEKLEFQANLIVPTPRANEDLTCTAATGINNTDINTHIGWCFKGIQIGIGTGAGEGRKDIDTLRPGTYYASYAFMAPTAAGTSSSGIPSL